MSAPARSPRRSTTARTISTRPPRPIVEQAYRAGSKDNLTVQIVRVDELPESAASEVFGQPRELPLPPLLEARMVFDGYRIVRELHGTSRSHIYLAVDIETDAVVTLKIPSIDLRDDPAYLKRFMMEEWVARRIDSAHVLKPCLQSRKRNFLYVVTEYIDGQTLTQWMIDNPKPDAGDGARHRRADRARACAPSTARRCCTRTSGPTTS